MIVSSHYLSLNNVFDAFLHLFANKKNCEQRQYSIYPGATLKIHKLRPTRFFLYDKTMACRMLVQHYN